MTTTTRTQIKALENNRVLMRYEDDMGEIVTREFWSYGAGSCVREVTDDRPGTLGHQVCGKLSHGGNTLIWSGTAPLVDLIRREYRALRRADHRRWGR